MCIDSFLGCIHGNVLGHISLFNGGHGVALIDRIKVERNMFQKTHITDLKNDDKG